MAIRQSSLSVKQEKFSAGAVVALGDKVIVSEIGDTYLAINMRNAKRLIKRSKKWEIIWCGTVCFDGAVSNIFNVSILIWNQKDNFYKISKNVMADEMRKILTLCVIYRHPMILLGMKKRGFGMGKWNGFGGKVKEGESVEKAAKREIWEEAKINPVDMEKIGIVDFEYTNDSKILEVHIFKGTDFTGEPAESEEMKPQWFHIEDIPFDYMWGDDRHWMPLLLEGKKFKGKFCFDDQEKIIDMYLEEVISLI